MRATGAGWAPMPGDDVEVWETPPAWGGVPPVASVKWVEPVRVVGDDAGSGRGARWVLADAAGGRSYIDQAASSLHAVEAAQGALW